MPAILAFAVIALVALAILGFAVHVLFTPWVLVPLAIVAWVRFRPGRSRR